MKTCVCERHNAHSPKMSTTFFPGTFILHNFSFLFLFLLAQSMLDFSFVSFDDRVI